MGTFFASYPSLTASANPSVGPNRQPIPGDSTLVAGENPSGNQQPLQTDSSGNLLVNIATEPGTPLNVNLTEVSGSAISLGQKTSANSLPVVIASDDTVPVSAASLPLPTEASTSSLQSNVQSAPGTPQTVAITVQGNASGVAVPVSAATLPLPTGAATAANQTNASQKTQIVDGSGNVIASTSNALNVQVENFPATQPISGTVTANQGTANATPWNQNVSEWGGTATTLGSKVSASSVPVVIASDQSNVSIAQATASALNATVVQGTPANLKAQAWTFDGTGNSIGSTSGALNVSIQNTNTAVNLTEVGGSAVSLGQNTAANSIPVVEATAPTSTLTQVNAATSSTSLLSSNTARKGAAFFNGGSSSLYLALATSASTTAYTVVIPANGYYEVPPGKIYTGAIFGIWSTTGGAVAITELS